ncbi:diaminopimelate epimerase [Virgibacillus siamensis]|uniref:diaminopimelate epimerase n=1 Tax=Virgibacillus siamensis TaxID=480071 RepID=UPI0009852314|nr:diaminopimelate epimerase [Virgibacillus siamensis]
MKIAYTKMHGLGNNYIYIDLFNDELDEDLFPEVARQVSDINTGIGSDGMIVIHPSDTADVGMRIFNRDGSEGMNCGNGLRCVAKYAYEKGIVKTEDFNIQTRANVVKAAVQPVDGMVEEITINMGEPILQRSHIPMTGEEVDKVVSEPFVADGEELEITAVSMGNPHAVFFVDAIEDAPLYELGPVITDDSRFPDGVNVEFVEAVSPDELNFRVWERGSGVTQACGTGACAAVVAAVLNGIAERGNEITVHLSGGDLRIKWDYQNLVWMTGGAEIITEGIYFFKD